MPWDHSTLVQNEEPPRPVTAKISAPLSNWKRVIFKELDPVSAITQNVLTLEGDLKLIMRYALRLWNWLMPRNKRIEHYLRNMLLVNKHNCKD